ncbi:MAG: hypothetical protein ABSB34_08820 [Candidatus Limnocylindrales bacterium]
MRPLMATVLQPAESRPAVGRYDEAQGVTVGSDGRPLATTSSNGQTMTKVRAEPADPGEAWAVETLTEVRNEPADDMRYWAMETLTRVRQEPADDARAWALETATKVAAEPVDDQRMWADGDLPLPPRDDAATGLVFF